MKNVYTVSYVNSYIKDMFTQDFMLNGIYIKGEISNCKYHTSGHIYFTLKDEKAAISAVMFASQRKNLGFKLQEGQKVIVLGNVCVYERDGKYQIYANQILLDGEGDLFAKYEKLKKELEEMGMFANEYKMPIKKYIRRLGVVTAPTGAAIQDIINITKRRNPYVEIILYPALVQGQGAAESIVRGIKILDKFGVDTIIVGRGGGSIEDLWAFNEEIVARAIFESNTPIISAVGHETDVTIADFVADMRAPTPSAAAELAVFEYSAIADMLKQYNSDLLSAMADRINDNKIRCNNYKLHLDYLNPINQIKEKRHYMIELEEKLDLRMKNKVDTYKNTLSLFIEKLNGLSPLAKLNQGYSYTSDKAGNTLASVDQVEADDLICISVSDGNINAIVKNKEKVVRS